VLFLLVAAGLMYLALKGTNKKQLKDALQTANYGYVLLSLVPATLAFVSRAWRWKLLLQPLGYKPKFSNAFYAMMFGYLANLALPRLGEVSRSVALNRSEKIPLDVIIGTVIAERAVDVLSLLLCFALALIIEFDNISEFFNKWIDSLKKNEIIHSAYIVPVLCAVAAILVITIILIRRRKKTASSSIIEKITLFFKGILAGLTSVMKMKNPGAFIFHSVFIWVMYWLVTYICFFSLNTTSSLDMNAGVFILVVGAIGMTLPVPGGFGSYHALVILGLSILNIEKTAAPSYAIIVHESQTLLVIIGGVISLLVLSVNKNKKPVPDVSA